MGEGGQETDAGAGNRHDLQLQLSFAKLISVVRTGRGEVAVPVVAHVERVVCGASVAWATVADAV
jgi:hypothetical protein